MSLCRRCLGLCKLGGEGLGESGYGCPFDWHGKAAVRFGGFAKEEFVLEKCSFLGLCVFLKVSLTICRSRRTAGQRQGIIAQCVQSHRLLLDGLQQLLCPLLIYRGEEQRQHLAFIFESATRNTERLKETDGKKVTIPGAEIMAGQ